MSKHELVQYLKSKEGEVLTFLQEMVEMESPTYNRNAVNHIMDYVRKKVIDLGAKVEVVPSNHENRGDHLLVEWEGQDNSLKPILAIAHLDTVYETGTLENMPFKVTEDKVYGPGVFDMKGATVFLLTAIKTIQELGKKIKRPIRCIFNSDEEMHSITSREIIKQEAQKAHCVLILEGGEGDAVVTSRKGSLYFDIEAIGKSSHSGVDHAEGINAVEELAHHILNLQSKTNYGLGTTVSCNIIEGGNRTNVIPSKATVQVNVRVTSKSEEQRIIQEIESLRPVLSGAQLNVNTFVNRPPFPRTDAVAELFNKVKGLASELDYELLEASSGGGSDGNLTVDLGIATLDGLGPIGEKAHSIYENIDRNKIPLRLALLVKILEQL